MSAHNLLEWLDQHAGVAHREDVRAAGFTDYAILTQLRAGAIRSVRKSWLVAPGADAGLVAAASAGARLTCAAATSFHRLWSPPDSHMHLAVGKNSRARPAPNCTLHWSRGPVPVRLRALVDPVENVLFHAAACLAPADALAVWESSLRGGRTLEYLRQVKWGSARAASMVDALSTLSDSGVETAFALRLRPLRIPFRQQVRVDGHRVDGLVDERLVIQLDGFAHQSDATQRRRDIRDDARLTLMGFAVLRFDYAQVMFDWPYVETMVLGAVAQGRHLPPR